MILCAQVLCSLLWITVTLETFFVKNWIENGCFQLDAFGVLHVELSPLDFSHIWCNISDNTFICFLYAHLQDVDHRLFSFFT